jgi:phosphate-selective porin OprO/OprP
MAAGSLRAQDESQAQVKTVGDETILIRNVHLFEGTGTVEPVLVNVVIKKGRLKLISKDRIPTSQADLVFDGAGGTLLGRLDTGDLAGFMILDQDPRENVEVLLDTAAHARFAILKGEIVLNNLVATADTDDEPERKWLGYQPPPFALPVSYGTKRKWNYWETKPVNGVFAAALMMDRQYWPSQSEENIEQVGDLTGQDRAHIRALRLGSVGTLNFKRPWVYTIWLASTAFDAGFDAEEGDSLVLFDWRLDIPLFKNTSVSFGRQKEPISMERLAGGVYLPIFERSSVSDSMFPSRNVGIVFNGTPGPRFTWGIGAFNDWIETPQSLDESATQYVGRITGLPFPSADESNLFHLGFGVRHSNAREGERYRSKPESDLSPLFVDTGLIDADSATSYDLEAYWRRGPFLLGGEFVWTEVEAPEVGDPVFSGYHLTASWIASGEMRAYNHRSAVFNQVPVARSVYDGGWGAWQVALRWSDLDLTDAAIEGGEMQILSTSLQWWLTSFFMIETQYRTIELDRFGLQGTADGLLTRVALILP